MLLIALPYGLNKSLSKETTKPDYYGPANLFPRKFQTDNDLLSLSHWNYLCVAR